jgi:hypothetical protein
MRELTLARTLFEEGVAHADAGDWEKAADRFERAYAIKPTPGIAFNWASALMRVGRLVEASELLRSVARDEANEPALREESQSMLSDLTPRLSQLRLDVRRATAHTEIELDGEPWPRPAWGLSSPVNPGEHVAVCLENGRSLEQLTVSLMEGESKSLTLCSPEPSTPPVGAEAPTSHAREDTPLWRSWKLWTAVGAVVVAGSLTAALTTRPRQEQRGKAVEGNTTPGVLRW